MLWTLQQAPASLEAVINYLLDYAQSKIKDAQAECAKGCVLPVRLHACYVYAGKFERQ